MIKKIIIYYLAFCVAIAPSFVFANTAGGTWQQVNSWQQGATVFWEAMKKEGDKFYNGYAKVKPTVKQVSSSILKGGKNATVAYALSVIVGEMVDYVLDPANNSVRVIGLPTDIYEFNDGKGHVMVGTADAIREYACEHSNGWGPNKSKDNLPGFVGCRNGYAFVTPKKDIPVDVVAAQVISNAESEHEGSKRFVADVINANTTTKDIEAQYEATKTLASDYVSPKDNTDTKAPAVPGTGAGEATGTNTGTGETTGTTEPTTPTDTKELPVFCGWAPVVCDLAGKVTEAIDWAKTEPELKDEQLEIKEQEITQYQHINHVRFGQNCPFTPTNHSISLGVGSFDFTADLTFICDFGHQARGTIIGVGYLLSLIFLIRGLRGT